MFVHVSLSIRRRPSALAIVVVTGRMVVLPLFQYLTRSSDLGLWLFHFQNGRFLDILL
jgi:hypothetical protein